VEEITYSNDQVVAGHRVDGQSPEVHKSTCVKENKKHFKSRHSLAIEK
jgi:hypothetical protein